MRRLFCFSVVLVFFLGAVACAEKETTVPRVIATFPLNGSIDVDPSLKELSVTFNESMMDGSWSWAYTLKEQFPQMMGQAYYTEQFTKNNLPVKLEPNKGYEIWINSQKFQGFKDKAGNSAVPYKWTFKTK